MTDISVIRFFGKEKVNLQFSHISISIHAARLRLFGKEKINLQFSQISISLHAARINTNLGRN